MILDNAINSPQRANGSSGTYRWTDGDDNGMTTSHDFVFHGVTMSRTGTVGVENFGSHPEHMRTCNAAITGRGCIRQAGGVIEQVIYGDVLERGDGFGENRSRGRLPQHEVPAVLPDDGPLHGQPLLRDRSGALQHHDALPELQGRLLTQLDQRLASSLLSFSQHQPGTAAHQRSAVPGLR